MKLIEEQSEVKISRRHFLKVFAVGGASFLLGQALGTRFNLFSNSNISDSSDLKDFRLVETPDELRLYNKNGEEVLTVDKESLHFGSF